MDEWCLSFIMEARQCIHSLQEGDRSDPSAYRVISITSILSRLFEKLVKCRLTSFLEQRGFFSPFAGFRHGHSTMDQIYKLRRDVCSQLSKRRHLTTVFLDIVKAFDRVQHDRLLFKLQAHGGVTGKAWGWLQAFLTDRTFSVTCGSVKSVPVPASAGVPQGTVLAALVSRVHQ